jgi:uroporphyrin-3 C-methyltransferase
VRPRSGRALALFSLLLALLALGGVGYLYQQLIGLPGLPGLSPTGGVAPEARMTDLATRIDRLESAGAARPDANLAGDLADLSNTLRAELDARLRAGAAATDARLRAIEAGGAAAPVASDWQLAEVQYLLRMANHRLLMERDVAGAVRLLRAADEVLRGLDDLSLHEVRARIASEVLALESLPALDAEGLFLQLEAIKDDLDRLPLRLPTLDAVEPAAEAPEGLLDVLRAEFGKLLRFRRFDGAVRPLLAPEEAVYLELNLRLMLERAQLAALRREQTIYDRSISRARDWIEAFLDLETPEVQRVLGGLRALDGLSLAAPLPDISGSLNALNDQLRSAP